MREERDGRSSTANHSDAESAAGDMTTDIFVRLLGRPDVVLSGGTVLPLRGASRSLLALLALNPDKPVRRDLVVDQLWNETSVEAGRKMLRTALWRLGRGLGIGEALICDREWICLQPNSRLTCDIWQVERTYAGAATDEAGRDITVLSAAAALYRGDFLEDVDETWCLIPRERYRLMYMTLLEWLVERHVHAREYANAVLRCQELLIVDRADEWAYRQLMRALHLSGNRTAALRQYDVCRQALLDELGVSPSRATDAIVERIQSDSAESPDRELAEVAAHVGSTSTPWLIELRGALVEAIHRLDADLG